MKEYSPDAYYRRVNEVNAINAHAYDRSISALRRDKWLFEPILKNNPNIPKLTEEQIREVEEFWRPYEFAYKNDYRQQEMFTGISGKFDPSYFGFGLQRHLMVSFWNHESFKWIGEKNFAPLYFPEAKMPETYVYNSCGVYFDPDRNPITQQQAVDLLLQKLADSDHREAIIKPSGGGEGKDISFIRPDASRAEVEQIIKHYGNDFICQRVIKNHPCLSALYSGSLNTMRMITLFWKNEVHYVGSVLRMGTNKRVDNWSQGGLACGIEPDGRLQEYAFTEFGHLVNVHPTTGFVFKDHVIYRFPEAIELVKKLHGHIAQQKFVSWDITVDEDGDLVLVELNSPGSHEMLQLSGQNGYGSREITKEIFDEYLVRRFFLNKANFDWDYREFRDHISLREYKGLDTKISVPKEIDGKPVRMLYENAIMQKNIEQIAIPRTVSFSKNSFPNVQANCDIKILVDD